MNDTILINRLPTRTWNRLGGNETAIAWGQADDLGEEKITAAGQTERGLAMMEESLAKGSLKRPDDLRLRLGAAYAQAGQTDQALRTLQAVRGSDGSADLARLWLLHLKPAVAAR